MIESIEFVNFKALRNATLPLAPFTLLLGPNGSGKSSVLQAIQGMATIARNHGISNGSTFGNPPWNPRPNVNAPELPIQFSVQLGGAEYNSQVQFRWNTNALSFKTDAIMPSTTANSIQRWFARMQTFSLDPVAIGVDSEVSAAPLAYNGAGLSAVLDDLKDNHPERWDQLLHEVREWLPEYDHIQFTKTHNGRKGVALRTKKGGHQIPASELSQGTLVALALLTLAYLPNPPSLIGLEEIDRGLHPRLLRHLQDALYRLSYPDSCGEKRPPIQVIATTHSPYLLDLYRDHPEEVVLAQKEGLEVQFKRLSNVEHFDEIIGNARLGDMWYTGIFGGAAVMP